jgi:hypothetical protein
MSQMAKWGELARTRPDLANAGKALLYQFGVGLAFLATVRKDGGPRTHPVCPLITDEGIYAFIIPSPKRSDLQRDGRYALHSFPCPDNEDAFYLTGTAGVTTEPDVRTRLSEQFAAERASFNAQVPPDTDVLVEFDISRCLLTRTSGHGDPRPRHEVWREG